MTTPTYDHLVIALGKGAIEVGQGHEGIERLPAILFGRNGAGTVGVETEGDRVMLPGECIAAITFENPESLDVVAEKLAELRFRIWPDAALPVACTAALDVLTERKRQIDAEGWTPEHDDKYIDDELPRAAMYYCKPEFLLPSVWPWDRSWWKPTDRRRNLTKAAALLIAEIERLDRATAAGAQP